MIRLIIQPAPKQVVDDREYLENLVEELKPGWLTRANERTDTFRTAGDYDESGPIWSEIKDVFLDIQHGKCAYCERKLGGKSYNRKEYDVEHYRPKNNIGLWPSKKVTEKMIEAGKSPYTFSTGSETAKGYYLLPYNISNYTAACTGCNSTLKSNYFPVASKRVLDQDDYELLKKEEPYLLYPLGETDENPEDIITFQGILPIPKLKRGPRHKRGRVTIDFFDLDIRPELIEERAGIIVSMWLAFETVTDNQSNDERKSTAWLIINAAISPRRPHTNCARSFYKLCQDDPNTAREFKIRAERIINS